MAILGVTGFLGRSLSQRLEAGGFPVRGVGRRPRPEGFSGDYRRLPAQPTADDWLRSLRDAGAVVNLVGHAHDTKRDQAAVGQLLFTANVEACAQILAACRAAGVHEILHVSSVKALAERAGEPLASTATARPTTVYGQTKRAGELLVQQSGETGGPRGTVIRLPLVYGAGAKGNIARVVDAVQRGRVIPLPSTQGRRSVASVNRVTTCLMECVRSAPEARTLHICDPEPITASDMVGAVARALGRPARTIGIPTALFRRSLRAAGKGDIAARLTQDLVMAGDMVDRYPPTQSRAGTLEEFGVLAVASGC